jgi:hypothetical protein
MKEREREEIEREIERDRESKSGCRELAKASLERQRVRAKT